MSYQGERLYERVVVCDICGSWGAIGDLDWRKMRHSTYEHPIHLCRKCRPHAIWCVAHQQYHLADSLHRRPCVACGGLFTAQVGQQIEHCPQCRRGLPASAARPTQNQPLGFLASLQARLFQRHVPRGV